MFSVCDDADTEACTVLAVDGPQRSGPPLSLPTSPSSASSSLPQPTSDHPHPGVRPNPKHPLGPHAVHLLLSETSLVSAPRHGQQSSFGLECLKQGYIQVLNSAKRSVLVTVAPEDTLACNDLLLVASLSHLRKVFMARRYTSALFNRTHTSLLAWPRDPDPVSVALRRHTQKTICYVFVFAASRSRETGKGRLRRNARDDAVAAAMRC